MKSRAAIVTSAIVVLLLLGCGKGEVERSSTQSGAVQLFEKGKGVCLPDEMRRILGVETLEAAQSAWPRRLERPARVYRAADAMKPAAAAVTLDESEARELTIHQPVVLQDCTPKAMEVAGTLVRCEAYATLFGQVEALVEFADAERRFAVGSSLRAAFILPQTETVSVVPESAVLRSVEGSFVYAVNGNHFMRTPVKAVGAREGSIGIIDGLYAGDMVVTKAAEALWMIELCSLKGGTPCCPAPEKNSARIGRH